MSAAYPIVERGAYPERAAQAARFRVRTAAEVAASPPIVWAARGVLPALGVGVLYGPPGCGKTFLALDLLSAIAAGRPWFGRRTRQCPVTVVALEGEAGLAQRVAAYRSHYGEVPDAMRFVTEPFSLADPADANDLVVSIGDEGAGGIVCIDTLNRSMPGMDENSSIDMGRAIEGAKRLQAMLGGLVLLVHHSGKDLAKGLRGHSSLLAAVDAAIEVTRDRDARAWQVAKAKDGLDSELHGFRLEVIDLGFDDEDEPVTSCVVTPEEQAAARRPVVPAGTNQRIAWDVIGGLLRQAGDARPSEAPAQLPTGRPVIEMGAAVEAVGDRLVCDSKRKRERAIAAISGLVANGFLVHAEGWLWCS